jgi:hypothetical protein
MIWWRADLTGDGAVARVVQVPKPHGTPTRTTIVFQAPDREAAIRVAREMGFRLYCAEKKKQAKTRLHNEGRCACGRPQDRKHPDGSPMLTCTVCALGKKTWNENSRKRATERAAGVVHVRDESARVQKNLSRQRDRRRELRLETLVEVHKNFWDMPTVKAFELWLEGQIEEARKPHVGSVVGDRGASAAVVGGSVTDGGHVVDRGDVGSAPKAVA